MDAEIKEEEVRLAILQQKKGKKTGEDVISSDFYAQNLETIAKDLTEVVNEVLTEVLPLARGRIKSSTRRASGTTSRTTARSRF